MTQLQGLITEGSMTENLVGDGLPNEGAGVLQAERPHALASDAATYPVEDSRPQPLGQHVKHMLEAYFRDLDGHAPADLYQMVLSEIEQPLLETVLRYTRGNQSKAAAMLGLNRGTLRKKLKQYDIN